MDELFSLGKDVLKQADGFMGIMIYVLMGVIALLLILIIVWLMLRLSDYIIR